MLNNWLFGLKIILIVEKGAPTSTQAACLEASTKTSPPNGQPPHCGRLLGRWAQNAPASSAFGARRAVLGRKALPLTPAAVCASPPVGYQPAIAPIPTQTPLPKTAA